MQDTTSSTQVIDVKRRVPGAPYSAAGRRAHTRGHETQGLPGGQLAHPARVHHHLHVLVRQSTNHARRLPVQKALAKPLQLDPVSRHQPMRTLQPHEHPLLVLYQDTDPTAVQRRHCPRGCFEAMACDGPAYLDARQVTGDVQMYGKTARAMTFLERYATQALQAPSTQISNPGQPSGDVAVLTNLAVMYAADGGDGPVVTVDTTHPCFLTPAPPSPPLVRRTLVITPTTGTADLKRCLESVQEQTVPGVEHLVVVDGLQYADRAQAIIERFALKKPVHTLLLPFNTGANAWNGHRVYASVPYLVDFEYIALLDEDNWYDPDHVAALLNAITNTNADWGFSLRKIDKKGSFVTNDNCESLGPLSHTVLAWDDVLVDTSCYLFKLPVARAVAPHWMHRARQPGEIEADR